MKIVLVEIMLKLLQNKKAWKKIIIAPKIFGAVRKILGHFYFEMALVETVLVAKPLYCSAALSPHF